MKFYIVLSFLFIGVGEAYSQWVVEANYAILHKLGFRPAEKIEKITGFKTESCEYKGKSLSTVSNDLGKCLVFAFLDFDENEVLNPIQMTTTSLASKKTFDVIFRWKPIRYQVDREGWLRSFSFIRNVYRAAELKFLIEYLLVNDFELSFSTPLSISDLSFEGNQKFSKIFSKFNADKINLSTSINQDGKLQGVLEVKNINPDYVFFTFIFKTNWSLLERDPLKAKLIGHLTPNPNRKEIE